MVFVGGDVDLNALTNPKETGALLATGNVGFYTQDAGIQAAYNAGTLPAIAAAVAGTGPGEAEINIQHGSYNLSWFQSWFQYAWLNNGLRPTSVNAIINYDDPNWVQDYQSFVQAAQSYGITSIAPIFSPNLGENSLATFATNPAYADLRSAALLGGGLTIDSPPSYFFQRGQAYQSFIYQEIQWAHANNLRATVLISPNYNDTTFLYDTQAFVKMLQWNNATPSEWVVENYTPDDPNGIGSDTDPNSIAGVALWVAQNAATTNVAPTTPPPTPTITVSAPGTVQEAVLGVGVNVTVSVHTTFLAGPVYWGVLTPQGYVETPQFYAVNLDADGNATITAHLANAGDTIEVASTLEHPSAIGQSTPVTITEPALSITLSALGTVQETSLGAGVTVTETIHTGNIAGSVYWGVLTAQGNVESPQFYAAALDANGNATITAHLAHSGDYIDVATSLTNPALLVKSTPVTITEPAVSTTSGLGGGSQGGTGGPSLSGLNTPTPIAVASGINPDFTPAWYLAQYPALPAGTDPLQDYLTSGWTVGRNPDPWFDSNYYLTQNPDVKASGMDPLLHYELYGWKEGRNPSLLFSDSKYLAAAPDVAAAHMDPLQHYILYGQTEGRAIFLTGGTAAADPLVNTAYYDGQLGATLIPGGTAGAQQAAWSYDQGGWQKGLNPDAFFDTKYYLAHNPDVAAAHVDPLLHYETYGWKEGRDPSAQFSTNKYLAAYADVKAAGVDPLLHYVQYGQAEGRHAFSV